MKVRVKVSIYSPEFEMDLVLKEGEALDDAADRLWEDGTIPQEAELRAVADDFIYVREAKR